MSAAWKLDANTARLAGPDWSASVDISRPEQGIAWGPQSNQASELGTIEPRFLSVWLGNQSPSAPRNADAYVRGRDLVVTYDEVPPNSLRARVYWRALATSDFVRDSHADVIAAFDLILSVNTSLLDNNPLSTARSTIWPATEAFQLSNDGTGRYQPRRIGAQDATPQPQAAFDAAAGGAG